MHNLFQGTGIVSYIVSGFFPSLVQGFIVIQEVVHNLFEVLRSLYFKATPALKQALSFTEPFVVRTDCDQRPGLCPIHTSSPGASISNPARSHNKRCVEPPRFRRGAVSFGRVFPPHGCSPPRCSRSTRITRFMPSVRYLLRWRTRK